MHVVATAGHVDHGKSSLIVRLTGIDPDRWEEEKRRGLTIDLGFAWTTLPSGSEIGFVDVPGHERFVRNMLAGVGPVRLTLFVVDADEGWKPQSEEHLAILDVLGAAGGVVALTKSDLVDDTRLGLRREEVQERLAGTVLAHAPVIACSSVTGEGLEDLVSALDEMVGAAPPPREDDRPRIHVDRSFTIKGAGTVVTGTLLDGTLSVGDEAELYPVGMRARIRSLQTHRTPVQVARPVSRVAANLAGAAKREARRGDVLGLPGQWRPTGVVEVAVRPVRGLGHPLTSRGAYKLYLGSAERDARLRIYGARDLRPGHEAFARLRVTEPVVTETGDRFVLREAGRRETVAGGVILDPDPPARPGAEPEVRLRRRASATPDALPAILVAERGAVRTGDLPALTGSSPTSIGGAERAGPWWVEAGSFASLRDAVLDRLARHHREHPLRLGPETAEIRAVLPEARPGLGPALEAGLADAVIDRLIADADVAREGTLLRLAGHRISLGAREGDAGRLVETVRAGGPTPPSARELARQGFARELIDAVCAAGRLVRVSDDIVLTPEMAGEAEKAAREETALPEGLTVSRFRERLGTTRKYAVPLLEHLDELGVTRRDGEVRRPGPAA